MDAVINIQDEIEYNTELLWSEYVTVSDSGAWRKTKITISNVYPKFGMKLRISYLACESIDYPRCEFASL